MARCQQAGIPIQARPEQISGLLYPLVLASMHAGDLGEDQIRPNLAALLELVAAFCLGEVELQSQPPPGRASAAPIGSPPMAPAESLSSAPLERSGHELAD